MNGRHRVAAAWNRFWFAEVEGTPLGLTRIGIALAGLVLWGGTLPLVRQFYSDDGEFPIAVARGWSTEYVARFLMPDVLGHFPVAAALFGVWGLALLALLVGWRTRPAAWLVWSLGVWFFYRNPSFTNGGDEVFRLASMYLALGYTVVPPAARAVSLDRRGAVRRGASDAAAFVPAWPIRMVQVQIGVVYAVSGFWKVVAAPWWDGSALAYALGNSTFSRFGAPDWSWAQPLFVALTLSVAWWELLFPALVVGRRTRRAALAFGLVLHGSILLVMNIGIFPLIMMGCYPAFLRPGEARALVDAVGGRRGPARSGPAQPSVARSASAPSRVAP